MATFTRRGETPPPTDGKWKPGGRGRPPKSATGGNSRGNLPGNAGGADSTDPDDLGESGDGINAEAGASEFDKPTAGQTIPATAYQLRRNPETYPRNPHTGLPIPLYRVTRTEDDLHNYIAALRPEDWGHCTLYVYRQIPRMKPHTYVDKFGQGPVDIVKIIAEWGSGVYSFSLNDTNIPGNRTTVMYAKLELSRDEYPEKIDLQTLDVGHPANAKIIARLIREGVLDTKGEPMGNDSTAGMAQVVDKLTNALLESNKQNNRQPVPPAPDPNAQAMAQVQAKTIEMLGDANKAALSAATAGNKSGGMEETVKVITMLVAALKPPDNSPMLAMMMEELKSNREATRLAADAAEKERQRNHELQMKAMEQKATAADPLAQVETFMKIKNIFGGGGGETGPRNWKEQGLAMLGEHLPQILDVGAQLVGSLSRPNPVTPGMVGAGGGGNGAGNNGGANGNVIEMVPSARQVPAAVQPEPQANPAGGNAPQPADDPSLTPEQRTAMNRIRILQEQLMQHGRFLVRAIQRGQDGYQFAEFLISGTDELTYARARGYSRDEWLTAIFSFPELQQTFAGAEQTVATFIEEFLAFGDGDGDDGDGEGEDGDGGNNPMDPNANPLAPTPLTGAVPPSPSTPSTTRTRSRKGKA